MNPEFKDRQGYSPAGQDTASGDVLHWNAFDGKRRLKSELLSYSFTATLPSALLRVCATA